jgi:L-amino acid N-acyltransferase YncA
MTRVRPARAADLPRILSIYNHEVLVSTATYDTQPRTAEEHGQWFAHHGLAHPVLVAESGPGVCGWASLSAWSDRPAYNRSLGHHALLARISAENTVSIRLHESFGFSVVGVLKEVGFKFGRMLDVCTMELVFPE